MRQIAPTLDAVERFTIELQAARLAVNKYGLRHGPALARADGSSPVVGAQNAARRQLVALARGVKDEQSPERKRVLAQRGVREMWYRVGYYLAGLQRIDLQPFSVAAKTDPSGKLVIDIVIQPRDLPIPDEFTALKNDIDTATNIITTVFEDRRQRRPPLWRAASWTQEMYRQQDTYLSQILGVAKVGLCTTEPSHARFAAGDLRRVTALFQLREAGRIKNHYVQRLLRAALVTVVVCLAAYVLARYQRAPGWVGPTWSPIVYDLRNFFLLAAGTAVGTWLSFSLRRPTIEFAELATLEPDRLNPLMRILFTIGLAGIIGLLLFSGAVVAGVGSVTGLEGMRSSGVSALLFGLLAGVAERALGAAVSDQGRAFAAAVGAASRAGSPAAAPAANPAPAAAAAPPPAP